MGKDSSRYIIPDDENYEPDSNNKVLKNYLGIKSKSEIEVLEEKELGRIMQEVEDLFAKDTQFLSEDLCELHEAWLGDIYPMAGKLRSVSMSKDDFPFAAPAQLPKLMTDFENDYLKKYTPCNFRRLDDVIEALAIVHVEFIIIHPFREGNGRLGRLLASLMANQAGLPPLDFKSIERNNDSEGFERYISAIHEGFGSNYKPMKEIFREIIEVTTSKVEP